jgi:hypothetical protein
MSDFLKTLNAAGIITIAVMIGLVYAVTKLVPSGSEHDMLMIAVAALGSQTITSTRTPSTTGGTTQAAVQIAPIQTPGVALVSAEPKP